MRRRRGVEGYEWWGFLEVIYAKKVAEMALL